jgi:hypothetical protein
MLSILPSLCTGSCRKLVRLLAGSYRRSEARLADYRKLINMLIYNEYFINP